MNKTSVQQEFLLIVGLPSTTNTRGKLGSIVALTHHGRLIECDPALYLQHRV